MSGRQWAVLRTTVVVVVGLVLIFAIDGLTELNRLDRWLVVIPAVVLLTLLLERWRGRSAPSVDEPRDRG